MIKLKPRQKNTYRGKEEKIHQNGNLFTQKNIYSFLHNVTVLLHTAKIMPMVHF